jgi:hypothetical protein
MGCLVSGVRFQVSEEAEKIKIFRNLGIEELTERTKAILQSPNGCLSNSYISKFLPFEIRSIFQWGAIPQLFT